MGVVDAVTVSYKRSDSTPQPESRLRAAGCVFAEDEAELLRGEATDEEHLEQMVVAREHGLPLEQIVGWADFAGVRVAVGPGVFVPRQRSALLVRLAAEHAPAHGLVVDLCCGTGAIGVALRARRPDLAVYATDLDPAAVACARRNLPPDVVHTGDLYDALPDQLRGRVDVLVVNAPYVPTDSIALMPPEAREHEHRIALDGGADGLDVQRRVVAGAAPWLVHDGVLLIETGADQAEQTVALMRDAGLGATVAHEPETGSTAVVGQAAPAS